MAIVRLFQVGREVRRRAAPGTLGHALARRHAPLVAAVLVGSLTADNLAGMAGLAQVVIWTTMLVRAGHLAVGAEGAA